VKKNIYNFIVFAIFFAVLFYSALPVLAFEITDYPSIPGFASPTEGVLETYVSYIFGFMCYIAGTIAIIVFAIGAVQLILNFASPALAKEGKDKMKGALIGLFLTLAAVVILKTINPQIVEISTTPLPETDGIYYTNNTNYISAPSSEANTANIAKGYETLKYKCSSGPALLIWEYPKINFAGNNDNYSGVKVVRKTCGQTESLSGIKSFKYAFETSGIYYCMGGCSETGTICSGNMLINTSSGVLSAPFKNNLKSIRIVNDISSDSHYGIVFHDMDDPMAGGNCSKILYSTNTKKEVECFGDISVSSSATVFYWNDKDYESSGTGVDFYSEPFGWANGAKAGQYPLDKTFIKSFWTGNASKITFSYTNITRPDGYKNLYQTFQQKPGAVKVKGNYLLVLWSGVYCQTFFKDIVNLKSTEITATEHVIDKINIIPIK